MGNMRGRGWSESKKSGHAVELVHPLPKPGDSSRDDDAVDLHERSRRRPASPSQRSYRSDVQRLSRTSWRNVSGPPTAYKMSVALATSRSRRSALLLASDRATAPTAARWRSCQRFHSRGSLGSAADADLK